MKKIFLILLYASLSHTAISQTNTNDPRFGAKILDEQIENIKSHGGKADYLNYWNMAVAYRHLGGPKDSIYNNLYKSMKEDPDKFSQIVEFGIQYADNNIKKMGFYKSLGEQFTDLVALGKKLASMQPKVENKITNVINQTVVDTLKALMALDQKYRMMPDISKNKYLQRQQNILDSLNAQRLYNLYKIYGYPGKSITGDNEYQDYFCLMVEHGQNQSNAQRFWLPIIAAALKKGELHASVFKMLVDRIHWLETGKQYFGSHSGIPLDTEEQIELIKKEYGL